MVPSYEQHGKTAGTGSNPANNNSDIETKCLRHTYCLVTWVVFQRCGHDNK